MVWAVFCPHIGCVANLSGVSFMENKPFHSCNDPVTDSRTSDPVAKNTALAILSGALSATLQRMKHPTFRVAMLVAPVILAVIGPFRSDIYDFWHALVLWTLIIWVATALGMFNRSVTDLLLPKIGFLQGGLLSSIVFAAYLTPLMRWVAVDQGLILSTELYPSDLQVFLTATFASFSVALVRYYLFHSNDASGVEPAQAPPPIFDRIAASRFDQIIRMTVNDHYVEIETDLGQERILMRFADAVREMGEGNGILTHRSHWVNPEAVTGCRKEGTKMFLLMRDGSEVPVSKTYRSRVADAGLAED
jgi:hypothetical protein